MVYFDFEKKVLDILHNPSDIFVMDFVDERLGRIRIDEYNTIITNSESFVRGNYSRFFSNCHEIRYEEISYFEAYRKIEKFCNFIKSIYPEKFIFVIEAYPVIAYYDETKSIKLFDEERIASAYRLEERLSLYYRIIKELMPNANYISFPYNIFAKYNHKWGLGYVHYEDKYYEIVLKQIMDKLNI